MPSNALIQKLPNEWLKIGEGAAARYTFLNLGQGVVELAVMSSNTSPTSSVAVLRFQPGFGFVNVLLSEIFPGATSGAYLFARTVSGFADVSISHS